MQGLKGQQLHTKYLEVCVLETLTQCPACSNGWCRAMPMEVTGAGQRAGSAKLTLAGVSLGETLQHFY